MPGYDPGGRCGALGATLDLGSHLTARTEALVDEVARPQRGERVVVEIEPLALANDTRCPIDADRREVGELSRLVFRSGLDAVEVLHPHDEVEAGRSRREPGDERGPQIAEVEIAGRRWREAAAHVSILPTSSNVRQRCRPPGGRRKVLRTTSPTRSGSRLDRRSRMEVILARDGATCVWCGRTSGRLVEATTEHVVPRIKGGPSWLENEVAACRRLQRETWASNAE